MKFPKINFEIIIVWVAFIACSLVTWHIFTIGMMKALVDQNSHLNLSRQVFDSLTPGMSQIGFWPPLLHVIMAPVVLYDPLYHSGLAGYVVLTPFMILAAVFLYRICLVLTTNQQLSFLGAILFIVNPFILYYTATPMMEVLYLTFLFGSAYYLLLWLQNDDLKTLITAGIFVSLTSLARFEGLLLIPISIIIVIMQQFRRHKTYYEIEAIGIIFGILGILGLLFIFVYGYIYGGSIMAFANSQWSAFNQQRDYLLPTEHSLINSVIYLVHSSYHVLGRPMVIFSYVCLGVVGWSLAEKSGRFGELGGLGIEGEEGKKAGRLGIFGTMAVLGSPFLFDVVALFRGNAIIYVPELLPYGVFFNERYGLYWIGFVIVVIVLAIELLEKKAKEIRYGYSVSLFLISSIVSFLLLWSIGWFYQEIYVNNYRLVKDSAQGYPSHDQAEVADYLREHYDWGTVFMTRALHDFIAVEAHVPLRNYVHESNYKYFDQVMERPWLFARWVVMYNPVSDTNGNWAKFNEKISRRYGKSDEFHKFYTLVVENDRERLYRIKPDAVVAYAASKNYSVKTIPSLNPALQRWNTDTVYARMKQSRFRMDEVSKAILTPQLLISSQFVKFYTTQLKPSYIDGYYSDAAGGSSTTQSYALLQTYWTGDKDMFETVWDFTRQYLQHQDDNLFSSVFSVNKKDNHVEIADDTSSTGADTDIAYALFQAGKAWDNPSYTREANLIIADFWDQKVASVDGRLIVASEKDTKENTIIDIKASAIIPYAYLEFAKHDAKHDWKELADDSYELLNRMSGHDGHPETSIFLPPEGAVLVKKTNKVQPPEEKYYSPDFIGAAYQVYFRIGLDAMGNKTRKAQDFIYVTNIFDEEWEKGRVCSIIRYQGTIHQCKYDLASLSAPLAVWTVKDKKRAEELVSQYYLKNRELSISSSASFSEKSWYWFGLGLWGGILH